MYPYIVLFILLIVSSVAVNARLQEALNIAKCIADVHQELTNSCVFFMNSEGEEQGENIFFFPVRTLCFGKNVLRYWVMKL